MVQLSGRASASKKTKEIYEKQYQAALKEVVDKQKEVRNASKPVAPQGRTGLTAAGLIELDKERERRRKEREKEETARGEASVRQREENARGKEETEGEKEEEDGMDVDEPEPEGKGKGRK